MSTSVEGVDDGVDDGVGIDDGAQAGAVGLDRVSVAYGTMIALDELSLEVAQGEVVAVIGPSGSGKSTLLRAMAGLEPLAGGTIALGGRSLDGVPTSERDLGLMFQDHALFPHLDVAGNLAFGLKMQRWEAARRRARVAELLDLIGLEGFEGRAVHELSGGEAQRVALARALAPQPGLLMLDEPFGSLDRVLREELTSEVRRLLVELGQTALHVTHDQGEAFALADRVAVLRDGRLEQIGRPVDLWRRPRSAFVAGFLGHPNIWTVDGQLLVVPVGAIEVVDETPAGVGNGPVGDGTRWVGRVAVESVAFREGRFRIRGELTDTAIEGGVSTVGGSDKGAVMTTFESSEAVEPGQSVRVVIDPGTAHLLDG